MILPWRGTWPKVHETAWLAPSVNLVGDVEIGEQSSLWFNVVARGDVNRIRIGARTNIQDLSLLHVTRPKQRDAEGTGAPLTIGDDVTVGHRVTLHGCTIGNRVLVGMGAIVMDGAVIGDDCLIGAGALVTEGTQVPAGHLVLGVPARVARKLKPEEIAFLPKSAANYVADSREYMGVVRGPERLGTSTRDLETLPHEIQDEEYVIDEGEESR